MGLPTFPIERAFLVGCWLEAVFWSFFTSLFGFSIYTLWTRRRGDLLKPPALVMVVMYILCTISVFVGLARLLRAFTETDISGALVATPRIFLTNEVDALLRAQEVVYCLNLAIIDSIIVWRCFVLWKGGRRYTIIPIVLLIGTLVSLVGLLVRYCLPSLNCLLVLKWCDVAYGLSLGTVAVANGMTAGRIWTIARKAHFRNSVFDNLSSNYILPSGHRVMLLIIVESGCIVLLDQIIEFILCRFNSPRSTIDEETQARFNAYFVVHLMAPQLMGIAHALIVAVVLSGITTVPHFAVRDNQTPTKSKMPFRGFQGLYHPHLSKHYQVTPSNGRAHTSTTARVDVNIERGNFNDFSPMVSLSDTSISSRPSSLLNTLGSDVVLDIKSSNPVNTLDITNLGSSNPL